MNEPAPNANVGFARLVVDAVIGQVKLKAEQEGRQQLAVVSDTIDQIDRERLSNAIAAIAVNRLRPVLEPDGRPTTARLFDGSVIQIVSEAPVCRTRTFLRHVPAPRGWPPGDYPGEQPEKCAHPAESWYGDREYGTTFCGLCHEQVLP